jgi:hypothetical protein
MTKPLLQFQPHRALRWRTLAGVAVACAVLASVPQVRAHPADNDDSLAKTRIASLYYGQVNRPEQRARAASFSMVLLNMWPSMGLRTMQANIDAIREANPRIKIAQYVVLNELQTANAGEDMFPHRQAADRNRWWARDSSGERVQWTSLYKAHELNLTRWAPPDERGRRWPQWKAEADTERFFGPLRGIDYIFVDNVFERPRVEADWKGTGRNQRRDDPEILAAYREGFVAYWRALRGLNPGLRIMGNADNDLSAPEYRGKLEGALLECHIGKNWSIETRMGWLAMMKRYRGALANTAAPHDVVLQVCGAADDTQLMRYGLASALLADGYFAYSVPGQREPPWFEDYAVSMGAPLEPPPERASLSGAWTRRYAGGLVMVNPGPLALTVPVEPGYRLMESQGQAAQAGALRLPARHGLILLKAAR